jgi:hypothetical protein
MPSNLQTRYKGSNPNPFKTCPLQEMILHTCRFVTDFFIHINEYIYCTHVNPQVVYFIHIGEGKKNL